MKLMIGCPIYDRSWIFDKWYHHVITSTHAAGVDDVSFVFVVDDNDHDSIRNLEEVVHRDCIVVTDGEEQHKDTCHQWGQDDFPRMVKLRNMMLSVVREEKPDLFLSLDSDILLEEAAIQAYIHGIELGYDAVGIVTSMCRQIWCESWMYFAPTAKGFVRINQRALHNEHFEVDAIMAGKMMTPKAYEIDYKNDTQGEDLGWNRNCHDAGVKRGIHGQVRGRHVMTRDDIEGSPVNFW